MEPIKPIKVIKVSAESPSTPIDNAQARDRYDPRTGDSELAEQYRHYPLMNFFGLTIEERQDDHLNSQVKDVYKWVNRRFPGADSLNMAKAVRLLEREIGMPQLGDTRLNNMWAYVHLENQIDELEDQKREQYGR